MKRDPEKEERDSKRKWLILLLLFLLFLLGILFGIFFQHKYVSGNVHSETAAVQGGVGLTIDPNAVKAPSQKPEKENTEEQGVAISGKGSIIASEGEREATVDFYNPEENSGLYYLTFELRLYNDSEQGYEVLYTSGLVEPGKHINEITLSRKLEKGEYKAAVHVQPYRMNENKTPTNNADMEIKLIVQ